jgi:hypothetical protein
MALAHKIQGESMQMIIFQLDEGQRVYCEAASSSEDGQRQHGDLAGQGRRR